MRPKSTEPIKNDFIGLKIREDHKEELMQIAKEQDIKLSKLINICIKEKLGVEVC